MLTQPLKVPLPIPMTPSGTLMVDRLVQPRNASCSMISKPVAGKLTVSWVVQKANVRYRRFVRFFGIVISRRLEHPAKALSPIYFKISGKRIDFSIRHEEKALRPIPVTLSGSSIFSRRVPQKAYVPILWMLWGKIMDLIFTVLGFSYV